jgi:predicted CopG family antitoxin
MYVYLHMSTKNIALRDDVYKKLKEVKGPNESFSDAIEELLKRKGSLLPLWSSLSESEAIDLIETDLKAIRNGAKIRA